jgi:hypothetical protein
MTGELLSLPIPVFLPARRRGVGGRSPHALEPGGPRADGALLLPHRRSTSGSSADRWPGDHDAPTDAAVLDFVHSGAPRRQVLKGLPPCA